MAASNAKFWPGCERAAAGRIWCFPPLCCQPVPPFRNGFAARSPVLRVLVRLRLDVDLVGSFWGCCHERRVVLAPRHVEALAQLQHAPKRHLPSVPLVSGRGHLPAGSSSKRRLVIHPVHSDEGTVVARRHSRCCHPQTMWSMPPQCKLTATTPPLDMLGASYQLLAPGVVAHANCVLTKLQRARGTSIKHRSTPEAQHARLAVNTSDGLLCRYRQPRMYCKKAPPNALAGFRAATSPRPRD